MKIKYIGGGYNGKKPFEKLDDPWGMEYPNRDLVLGAEYDVRCIQYDWFSIVDRTGEDYMYPIDFFAIVDSTTKEDILALIGFTDAEKIKETIADIKQYIEKQTGIVL